MDQPKIIQITAAQQWTEYADVDGVVRVRPETVTEIFGLSDDGKVYIWEEADLCWNLHKA